MSKGVTIDDGADACTHIYFVHIDDKDSRSSMRPTDLRCANQLRTAIALTCLATAGCGVIPQKTASETTATKPVTSEQRRIEESVKIVNKVSRKADTTRIAQLETEIARLKLELSRAEETLVAVESGLQSGYTRADAVASLAETQIQLDRTARLAPWYTEKIDAARDKLEKAKTHIDAGRFGAGLFFVYRVNSIVRNISEESQSIRSGAESLFVKGHKVNLRRGASTKTEVITTLPQGAPLFREERSGNWLLVRTLSGEVGWIHGGLVTREAPDDSDAASVVK